MILIVYGEHKELFVTEAWSVPDAIKELYQYEKGDIDEELFDAVIEGLIKSASVDKMVGLYNALAIEKPIHKIFTEAMQYWRADNALN